jgi:hypothetical protein
MPCYICGRGIDVLDGPDSYTFDKHQIVHKKCLEREKALIKDINKLNGRLKSINKSLEA